MRHRLWPDQDAAELEREAGDMAGGGPDAAVFVAEDGDGSLIGFVEVGRRSYAEGGPDGPAAYVEAVFVEAGHRRRGVARALLGAAERWGRSHGLNWLGSDALLDNEVSHAWHRAAGFAEVERLVVFGKPIG